MNDKNSCSAAAQAKRICLGRVNPANRLKASQPWQHCALTPPRRCRRLLMRCQWRRSRQLMRWRWTRSRSSCQWSLGPAGCIAGARLPTWVRAPQVQRSRRRRRRCRFYRFQRSRRHLRRGPAGQPAQGPEAKGDANCRFIQEMNTMGIVAIAAFAESALDTEAGTASDVKAC